MRSGMSLLDFRQSFMQVEVVERCRGTFCSLLAISEKPSQLLLLPTFFTYKIDLISSTVSGGF